MKIEIAALKAKDALEAKVKATAQSVPAKHSPVANSSQKVSFK